MDLDLDLLESGHLKLKRKNRLFNRQLVRGLGSQLPLSRYSELSEPLLGLGRTLFKWPGILPLLFSSGKRRRGRGEGGPGL